MANTMNSMGSSKELFGQVSPERKFIHRAAISAYIDRPVYHVKMALEAPHCKPKLDPVLMNRFNFLEGKQSGMCCHFAHVEKSNHNALIPPPTAIGPPIKGTIYRVTSRTELKQ
jgi:hypothetical protein